MSLPRSLTLLAIAPLFVACGFSSGLPGNTQGKDLSPAENKQFCEAQTAYVSDAIGEEGAKKFGCLMGGVFVGVLSGGGAAACQKSFDDCMAEPAEPSDGEAECSEESNPECTATVAELEACVEETTSTIVDKLGDATCQSAMSDATLLAVGPKCKIVEDKGCESN